mgnify:FL=1
MKNKIVEFLKNRWLFILVAVLLTIIFIQSCERNQVKDELEIFREKDKKTLEEIKNLEKFKTVLLKQRDSLQTKIDGLKVESNNNKNKRDEEITRIDNFTADEHAKFFSEWSNALPKTNK